MRTFLPLVTLDPTLSKECAGKGTTLSLGVEAKSLTVMVQIPPLDPPLLTRPIKVFEREVRLKEVGVVKSAIERPLLRSPWIDERLKSLNGLQSVVLLPSEWTLLLSPLISLVPPIILLGVIITSVVPDPGRERVTPNVPLVIVRSPLVLARPVDRRGTVRLWATRNSFKE